MEWLKISTSVELTRLETDDIVYIKAQGNYCDIVTFDNMHTLLTFKLHFMDECLQQLHDNHFVRVGKSLIVNKHYVYLINLTDLKLWLYGKHLVGTFKLSASREALKELKVLMENENEETRYGKKG